MGMSTTIKMYNGDIFIDLATGKPRTISGPEKVSQDVGEILLTLLIPEKTSRSSVLFPRPYGSELPYIQTPIQYSGIMGKPLITKKIQEAIERLQSYQKSDPNSTADERIDKITALVVNQTSVTDFTFYLELVLEGGTQIQMEKLSPTSMDHLVFKTSYIDSRRTPRMN